MKSTSETQELNQQQGNGSACNGAQNVCQIQVAEGATRLRKALADGRHGEGKRRAHTSAPGNEGKSDPESSGKVVSGNGEWRAGIELFQKNTSPYKFAGNEDRRHANQELGQGVETQCRNAQTRFTVAEIASSSPGPRAQPDHECRQNNRNQSRGDRELRHRQTEPHQFVENAAETGNKEKTE